MSLLPGAGIEDAAGDPAHIEPLDPDVMTAQADYILGVIYLQDNLIFLLHIDRLLLINNSLNTAEEQEGMNYGVQ